MVANPKEQTEVFSYWNDRSATPGPRLGRIWSEENKYRQWLEVELAAAEALAETGEVPAEAAQLLRQHARFDVARIQEIEREVRHDVIAFTTAVAESMAAERAMPMRRAGCTTGYVQRCGRHGAGAA